jgi:hypothetical protein
MKRAILAVAFTFAAFAAVASAALAGPADAPTVASLGVLLESDIHWGMTHANVVDVYNRPAGLFDREYAPRLGKLQPGAEMDDVIAERDGRKTNFAHAYSAFEDTPTGYDLTPLKSEYTYNNGEAIQSVSKDGRTRYFFYFKDHLWKVYDEVPLRAGGPLGDTYATALAKLGAMFEAAPRVRRAGVAGLERTTADWQDAASHLRVVDRSSEQLVGLVLEDKRTLANLATLRSNKPADPFAIDPSISAITSQGVTDPNAARAQDTADAGATKKRR